MPFQHGNRLGGRSKIQFSFEKKCRAYMDEEGWVGIEEMADSKDKKTKMWALEQMMNRGFGRPKETVNVTTRDESLRSPDQLAGAITELIAGEEGGSNPDPGGSSEGLREGKA